MIAGPLIAIVALASVALLALPGSGSLDLHRYADNRQWLGIPNAGDVLSNLPFVLIAAWALWRQRTNQSAGALPLTVFFVSVLMVGLGSAYYHWSPTDRTLAWDRLPMAIAFMALLTAFAADYFGADLARRWLWPLAAIGAASVVVWRASGLIWPYALVQLAPIVVAVGLCAIPRPPSAMFSRSTLLSILVLYGLAKVSEEADVALWTAFGQNISGHTLKHLAAAGAALLVAHGQSRRALIAVDRQDFQPLKQDLG